MHRGGILYFTSSSSSKVYKYVQAAVGVHYTIQAANRYVQAAASSSNMEAYKQERESRNGYIVVFVGRRCG